jgi:hypothetical protein
MSNFTISIHGKGRGCKNSANQFYKIDLLIDFFIK